MKFLIPLILLGVACGLFFGIAKPMYAQIEEMKTSIADKQVVLDNAEKLKQKSADLTSSYNQFSESDKDHLKALLPDDIQSMQVILAVHNISKNYNMLLKNAKFDVTKKNSAAVMDAARANGAEGGAAYNTFEMQFTLIGKYADYVSFTRDLEKSLRVVDAAEVAFSTIDSNGAEVSGATLGSIKDILKFDVKIKTYWLK